MTFFHAIKDHIGPMLAMQLKNRKEATHLHNFLPPENVLFFLIFRDQRVKNQYQCK